MQPSQFQQGMQFTNFPSQFQFQPPPCVGTENLTNPANVFNVQTGSFSNVAAPDQSDFQGTGTAAAHRIMYTDGRTVPIPFSCGSGVNATFQPCTIQGVGVGVIADTGGGGGAIFQQQGFINNIRQQQPNHAFRNDNFAQRKYVNRPQQGNGRFLRLRGIKPPYRNFTLNQNQNRRFVTKNFNYKVQKTLDFCQSNNLQHTVELQQGFVGVVPAKDADAAVGHDQSWMTTATSVVGQMDDHSTQKDEKYQKSAVKYLNSKVGESCNLQKKSGIKRKLSANVKISKHKMQDNYKNSPPTSPHNLSYESISENSNEEIDSPLSSPQQETLARITKSEGVAVRRRNIDDVIVKREPGEIYSDEDGEDQYFKESASVQPKRVATSSGATKMKKSNSSSSTTSSVSGDRSKKTLSSTSTRGKENRHEIWKVPRIPGGLHSSSSSPSSAYIPSYSYSYHDNRYNSKKQDGSNGGGRRGSPPSESHGNATRATKAQCHGKHFSSGEAIYPSNGFCCPEAELVSVKGKIGEMKKSLRETKDKLLEVTVVGSKNSKRLQGEVDKLKSQLSNITNRDSELKESIKKLEDEVAVKSADLVKVVSLYETEKQERAKFELDVTRKLHDRLAVEKEKLGAFFDIEIAKMQSFYLAQNRNYYEGSYFRNSIINHSHNTQFSSSLNNLLLNNQANESSMKPNSNSNSVEKNSSTSTMNFAAGLYDHSSNSSLNTPRFGSMSSNNTFTSEGQGYLSSGSNIFSYENDADTSKTNNVVVDSPSSPDNNNSKGVSNSDFFSSRVASSRNGLPFNLNSNSSPQQ